MGKQLDNWLYDPQYSFADNLKHGPFGDFDREPAYQNVGEPEYDFFGTKVYAPFGIAAGPLPQANFVKAALDRGFDIVTFKTVRSHEYPCLPAPNVHPVELVKLDPGQSDDLITIKNELTAPLSMANSFGIPSFEPPIWQAEIKKSFQAVGKGQALLVAFQGTLQDGDHQKFVEDHVAGVGLLAATGAKVIEINLSCPNEGHSNYLCFDIDTCKEILLKIRATYEDLQIIVKITYFNNAEHLRNYVQKIGPLVDGITAINTVAGSIVNPDGTQAFSGPVSRLKAGVSGKAIKHLGIEMVERLVKHRAEFGLDFKIIGVGGVLTAQDFHDYRQAGADFVMGLTGVMWNPKLAAEIKVSLHNVT